MVKTSKVLGPVGIAGGHAHIALALAQPADDVAADESRSPPQLPPPPPPPPPPTQTFLISTAVLLIHRLERARLAAAFRFSVSDVTVPSRCFNDCNCWPKRLA